LIGEYDPVSGNPMIEHVWLGSIPVAAIKNATVYYVYPDHLGTPRAITDTANQTVWYWNYDEPFGETAVNDDPNGTGAFVYNLRFPGQYFDAETGLHYNWHRDFNPVTGKYIQSDPIGLWGGINTYGYVANDPVNGFDPNGLLRMGEGCGSSWARIQFAERKIREELEKCDECKSGKSCIPCSLKDQLLDKLNNTEVTCKGYNDKICADAAVNGYSMTLYGTEDWRGCGCLASLIYHELLHGVGFRHAARGKPDAVNAMTRNCRSNLCGVNDW
jgi:RHS repeat-associated protein